MRKFYYTFISLAIGATSMAQTQGTAVNGINHIRYLKAPAFTPLPYGSIQPSGWLKDWCLTAKNGLVGHNKAFDTGWIDGQPASFLNEQTAYWIDGRMRLGIVLKDNELINNASKDIRSVIEHDYLRPSSWSSAVYARAIVAYYLFTGKKDALNYLSGFFNNAKLTGFYEYEAGKDPNNEEVKRVSSTEPRNLVQVEALFETYMNGGDPAILQKGLDALAYYKDHFVGHWTGYNVNDCTTGNGCINSMHGVTYNELAKLWAIGYLFNGNKDYLKASENAYRMIDSLHMMPYGVNSAMENLMGVGPTVGTETCDVADFINSNIWMYRISGRAAYGDRIEKAFFNAAPASVDHDFKKLVYLQSPNNLKLTGKFAFEEVHDPKCCSGNQARLLPNYILHMLMATADHGIAFNLYGPCKAVATAGSGVTTKLSVDTNYPFEGGISIQIDPVKPDRFPVYLRVPAWSRSAAFKVNGVNVNGKQNAEGFVRIDRTWRKGDRLLVHFERKVELKDAATKTNNAVSSLTKGSKISAGRYFRTVEYGPLLFALDLPSGSPYQLGLLKGRVIVKNNDTFKNWNWSKPPVKLIASAVKIAWPNAPELPDSRVKALSKPSMITLIPYGSTHGTRIAMFPRGN